MYWSRRNYQHINFVPPKDVADTAALGLELREQFGRGGTDIEVARARNLRHRRKLVPETIRQMMTYFRTHEAGPAAAEPSNDYITWLLYGGDPGRRWAEKVHAEMDAVDRQQPRFRRSTAATR
jgi:hypothetical protein